jgi:hypothetical protein
MLRMDESASRAGFRPFATPCVSLPELSVLALWRARILRMTNNRIDTRVEPKRARNSLSTKNERILIHR